MQWWHQEFSSALLRKSLRLHHPCFPTFRLHLLHDSHLVEMWPWHWKVLISLQQCWIVQPRSQQDLTNEMALSLGQGWTKPRIWEKVVLILVLTYPLALAPTCWFPGRSLWPDTTVCPPLQRRNSPLGAFKVGGVYIHRGPHLLGRTLPSIRALTQACGGNIESWMQLNAVVFAILVFLWLECHQQTAHTDQSAQFQQCVFVCHHVVFRPP